MPTTQVHSYTLKVPQGMGGKNFLHFSILSVIELDIPARLKQAGDGCLIVDEGLVKAEPIPVRMNDPWKTELRGFRLVRDSQDSRGCYVASVMVPADWDANHPEVAKIQQEAREEAARQNSYYATAW